MWGYGYQSAVRGDRRAGHCARIGRSRDRACGPARGAQGARQCSTGFLRAGYACVLVFALAFGLGGCSAARFGYDHGDTLALAYLDGYLDLDTTQEEHARAALRRLFAWHRAQELPGYARELARMRDGLDREVTASDIAQLRDFAGAAADRIAQQAMPEMIALAQTLRAEQIAHLQEKFEQANKAYRREHLEGSEAKLHQRRVDRVVEQMERWLGDYSERQRIEIAEWVAAVPYDREQRYAERVERQQALIALLRALQRPALTQEAGLQEVRAYVARFATRPVAQTHGGQALAREAGLDLVARMVNHATAEQRATARKRLQGWIADIESLHAATTH